MPHPDPGTDDTVRLGPAALSPRAMGHAGRMRLGAIAAAAGLAAAAAIGAWMLWPRPVPVPSPAPVSVQIPLSPPVGVLPPSPPAADLTIRTASEAEIRDNVSQGLTVFRFADDPRILVLDFGSLHEQGQMLNRIAALAEKAELPHDRPLNDADLDTAIRHGGDTPDTYYYGHDYSAAELARFFTLADQERLPLNTEELKLRRLLRQENWLTPGVQAGLISIPAVDADSRVTPAARSTILQHELSHGLFFSDPTYAAFVRRFWHTALRPEERDEVRQFLKSEGYDTGLEELMINEMQAYLMFTRDPAFFSPDRIGMTPARLATVQAKFLRDMPAGWLRDKLAAESAITPVAEHAH